MTKLHFLNIPPRIYKDHLKSIIMIMSISKRQLGKKRPQDSDDILETKANNNKSMPEIVKKNTRRLSL
jgi:hypothetical protein